MIGKTNATSQSNTSVWFGDGSDGELNVPDGQKLELEVASDEGQIVKQYTSGYIGVNSVLTAANRCNGMVLCFEGDLEINGHINMDMKAPLLNNMEAECAKEQHIALLGGLTGGDAGAAGRGADRIYRDSGSSDETSYAAGGTPGKGYAFGGGYGPGSGASTAKGGDAEPRPPIGTPIPYPGDGDAGMWGAGGGASPYIGGAGPGGSGAVSVYYSSERGTNGLQGEAIGGGLLVIYVGGKLNITETGLISADGGNGADGVADTNDPVGGVDGIRYGMSGGGGGAGGGIIAIVHSGDYNNAGSIHANGGKGGLGKSATRGTKVFVQSTAGTDGTGTDALITTLKELLTA